MNPPWEEPPEPLAAADQDLPLAGLLAELLASADAQPGQPDEYGEAAQPGSAPTGGPGEHAGGGLAVPDMMRALSQVEELRPQADPEEFPSRLLARLLEETAQAGEEEPCPAGAAQPGGEAGLSGGEPAVEPPGLKTSDRVASVAQLSGRDALMEPASDAVPDEALRPGPGEAIAAPGEYGLQAEDGPLGAMAADPAAEADPGGKQPAEGLLEAEASGFLPGESQPGPHGAAPALTVAEAHPAETCPSAESHAVNAPQESGVAPEQEWRPGRETPEWEACIEASFASPASAPEAAPEGQLLTEGAPNHAGIAAASQPLPDEAEQPEMPLLSSSEGSGTGQAPPPDPGAEVLLTDGRLASSGVSGRPDSRQDLSGREGAGSQGLTDWISGPRALPEEEDEFELVDAETAGRMLDQLLDAARSAIQSSLASVSQPPQPAGQAASGQGESAAGARPGRWQEPMAKSVSVQVTDEVQEETGNAGDAAWRRPVDRGPLHAADELGQEPPPLPPAAALIGMGLPERLRARLEKLGNLDNVLAVPPAAGLNHPADLRRRLLVFRVGREYYGLPIESVREVERVPRVTPVPGAPRFLRGLVNLRGEILPLVDMRLVMGATVEEGQVPNRLIVAQWDKGEPPVALLVDELNGLAPVGDEPRAGQLTGMSLPHGARGSIEHRGRTVWWLDPAALLGQQALEELAGLE